MKNRKYLIWGLAAILPALVSCSSEDTASGESDRALTKIAVSASINTGSRVELSDPGVGKGLKEHWSIADAFLAQNGTTTPIALTKSSVDADLLISPFIGDFYAADGDKLYGYYPASLSVTSGASKALVDFSLQGGTLAQVQKHTVMTAYTTYASGTTTNFPFSNATAILRVKINLPVTTATQVTKLTVSGTNFNNREYLTLSEGGTSWAPATIGNQVSILNATGGVTDGMTDGSGQLTCYVTVIPQSLTSGFTVTAQTKDNKTYSYTVGSASIAASNVLSVNSGNTEWTAGTATTTGTVWNGNYYCWDAPVGTAYSSTSNANTSTLNSSPSTDVVNVAQRGCTNCPTYKQIEMYLGAGVYLDSYTSWTGAPATHYGIWLKKACYIDGFAEGTAKTATLANYTATITSSNYGNYTSVLNSGEYFFLPGAGDYGTARTLSDEGMYGGYWSSTPNGDAASAYALRFQVRDANLGFNDRSFGYCLWTVQ
jgi:hypothetical protein